jgi:cytochrome c556
MSLRMLSLALAAGLAFAGCLRADLTRANAERNLEKRSKLALENAMAAYQAARAAYDKGDNERVAAAAAEIEESVDLAYTSLKSTGKDPRRSPKWFKRAEIDTRDLVRKLEGFQQEMSFADRPVLDKVKARVQQVHDDLLLGLMEGKKK